MFSLVSFGGKLAKSRYLNRWLILIVDLFVSTVVTVLSLLLTYYVSNFRPEGKTSISILLASFFFSLISFFMTQTYKGIIRHSVYTETGRLAFASFLKIILLYLFITAAVVLPVRMEMLICLIDLLLTFFFLTIFRLFVVFFFRALRERVLPDFERVLIYGDNRIISDQDGLIQNGNQSWQIVGCLQWGKRSSLRIGHYKVYFIENQESLRRLVLSRNIRSILFTDVASVRSENDRIVSYCLQLHLKMLLLPAPDELQGGKVKQRNLAEVRIEDLLGREEIKINMNNIVSSLKSKSVLVTGAAGSIGSELCRQLCAFEVKDLVLFDSAETPMHNIRLELEERFPKVKIHPVVGDVRMVERMDSIFNEYRPLYVFHAAAYKHVPLMEENPCEAVYTNVYGTFNVANIAVKYGVEKFVMISTDKAVNPTNVMGASKRLAEIYVQSLSTAISKGLHEGKTRFITTRFGNVLGSNGSVIPRFKEQLMRGGPLTVTHPDIIRYFMTISEACKLVLEAGVMGNGNEIFVFDMGTPVKIADLARRMIELAGLVPDKDIKIEYTGLRPGEKLYEELLATKENTLPTFNEKIFRAKVREYEFSEISRSIKHLTELAIAVKRIETVREMKRIVPEFKSKNSVYETLDAETVDK